MNTMWMEIIKIATIESFSSILQIALIIIPLMVILRIAKEANLLNKISEYFEPLTAKLYLSKEATFPLLVGTTFGVTYGAGLILQAAKEGNLQAKDLLLLNVFIGLNHAIFEDSFLFGAVGGNVPVIFTTRFLIALIVTYLLGKWLKRKQERLEKYRVSN